MTKGKAWKPFDAGRTLGQEGSEYGVIILDEVYQDSARITLERNSHTAPFAITCWVVNWMVHTRYFSNRLQAELAVWRMKHELQKIVGLLGRKIKEKSDDHPIDISEQVKRFIRLFP